MSFQYSRKMGLFSYERTPVFDGAVEMCRMLLNCEVSLLTLIDKAKDRQFFKAEIGLPPPFSNLRETPLSHSFCKSVVASGKPLIISDARIDEKAKDNPVIEELGVIAYLGVPIKNEAGKAIAALCAIDGNSREWTSSDLEIITAIGAGVSHQIRLMATLQGSRIINKKENRSLKSKDALTERRYPQVKVVYVNSSDGEEFIESASGGCEEIWEISSENFKSTFKNFFAMSCSDEIIKARASLGYSAASLKTWQHQWCIISPLGKKKLLRGYGQPEILPDGGIRWSAIIRDASGEGVFRKSLSEHASSIV